MFLWPTWLNRCSRKLWSFFCLSWDSHTLEGISSPAQGKSQRVSISSLMCRMKHVFLLHQHLYDGKSGVCVCLLSLFQMSAFLMKNEGRYLAPRTAVMCVYGSVTETHTEGEDTWQDTQLCEMVMTFPAEMCGQTPVTVNQIQREAFLFMSSRSCYHGLSLTHLQRCGWLGWWIMTFRWELLLWLSMGV